MNRSYHSRYNPFCKSTNTGPPAAVTLLLGVFVVAGGIGGSVRYLTREKPKVEPKPITQPAALSSQPNRKAPPALPTIDLQSQDEPSAFSPTPSALGEALKGIQVDESFKYAARLIAGRSRRECSPDELRYRAVKWNSMSRASQEELLQIIQMAETKSRELTKHERDLLVEFTGDDHLTNRR